MTGFLPILWAHGGRVVNEKGGAALDSDAALKALNLFLALKESAPKGVATYNSSEVRDALMKGTAAMSIELWPSWAPSLDDPKKSRVPGKIEIMAAPGETEQSSPMLGTWLLAVPADAPNPKRGRAFIDFVTSAANQKALALEFGTPPTRASVYGDADVVGKYRWYPAQLAALRKARPRPRITQWTKVEAVLGDYLQLALVGQMGAKGSLVGGQPAGCQSPEPLVWCLTNTVMKLRGHFGRRQGAMTSSGRYHARKSNAADGQKDPQIRNRICETPH